MGEELEETLRKLLFLKSHYFIADHFSDQTDWINIPLSNLDEALEMPLVIENLLPATRYELTISAKNDAGSTNKNYVFATLSVNGGKAFYSWSPIQVHTTLNVA